MTGYENADIPIVICCDFHVFPHKGSKRTCSNPSGLILEDSVTTMGQTVCGKLVRRGTEN